MTTTATFTMVETVSNSTVTQYSSLSTTESVETGFSVLILQASRDFLPFHDFVVHSFRLVIPVGVE